MDEFDYSDPESEVDPEEQAEPAPAPRQLDAGKLKRERDQAREEAKKLRSRMNGFMTDRFGEEIVGMLPDQVPWEARWDLAEKIATKLGTSGATTPDEGKESSQEEEKPTPEEQKLASVAGTTGNQSPADARWTYTDYRAAMTSRDAGRQAEAVRASQAGLVDR
jgi:hypothetical protein